MQGECETTGEHANSQSAPHPIACGPGSGPAFFTGQQHCAQQLAPSAVYLHVPCVVPVTNLHYSMLAWGKDMQPQESMLITRPSFW